MRVKGQSFLEREGEEMKIGRWTDLETVILLEATENLIGDIKDLTVPKTDELEQLVTLYNDVLYFAKSHGCMCNRKEKDQIRTIDKSLLPWLQLLSVYDEIYGFYRVYEF
ncbi:hypothetical protein OS493_018307 [Desmophyllum pertusum]|uniref:Uncharacterized protein n=1 Tax=Desmophyllum pertusum TaxID=174260 RepID=A0A9X0CG71_9CNID|nr:hypothetical protein OS493_018307 [Desmophyllum pertusum]